MHKPPLSAALLTLLGFVILCSLGTWQLYRLQWKTELLQHLDAEYAKDPQALTDFDSNIDFQRGTVAGRYDFNKQITIGPRLYQKQPGRHVITPLKLKDGSVLLVNRGWVPQSWKSSDEKTLPKGNISVSGLLRKPSQPNSFSPTNNPSKDEWYYALPSEVAAVKKIENIRPFIFYIEPENPDSKDYPIANENRPELANNHLQYAGFWFLTALTLLVIFFLRFVRT